MSRKSKTVPLSKISEIQATLKKKAATPKNISLQELIHSLATPIQDMLDAGYSYEDVSEVFKGHGVLVAASGIRSYHRYKVTTTDQLSTKVSVETDIETDTDKSDSKEVSGDKSLKNQDALSPVEIVEKSERPPSKSTKTQKGSSTSETSSKFNVTDRSQV
jgi:hypothetical protein